MLNWFLCAIQIKNQIYFIKFAASSTTYFQQNNGIQLQVKLIFSDRLHQLLIYPHKLFDIRDYNLLGMTLSDQKKHLPLILSQYVRRLSSNFISRLVLFEKQTVSNTSVGHYDFLCEGIEVIIAFFKKRQQVFLIKSLTQIRDNSTSSKLTGTQGKDINMGTKRTYISSNFLGSEVSPFKRHNPFTLQDLLQQNEQNSYQNVKPRQQKQQNRLEILLSRVKSVNLKSKQNGNANVRIKTETANLSDLGNWPTQKILGGTSRSRKNSQGDMERRYTKKYQYQSQTMRSDRRQIILDKFKQIQSNLLNLKVAQQMDNDTGMSIELINDIQNLKNQLQQRKTLHI